jgi:hypothetical protein
VTAAFAVPLTGDLAATAWLVLAAAVDFTAAAVLLLLPTLLEFSRVSSLHLP